MNFREIQPPKALAGERRAVPQERQFCRETPIPPAADFEYANRLGVEYFSLIVDRGDGVLRPRMIVEKAKQR